MHISYKNLREFYFILSNFFSVMPNMDLFDERKGYKRVYIDEGTKRITMYLEDRSGKTVGIECIGGGRILVHSNKRTKPFFIYGDDKQKKNTKSDFEARLEDSAGESGSESDDGEPKIDASTVSVDIRFAQFLREEFDFNVYDLMVDCFDYLYN